MIVRVVFDNKLDFAAARAAAGIDFFYAHFQRLQNGLAAFCLFSRQREGNPDFMFAAANRKDCCCREYKRLLKKFKAHEDLLIFPAAGALSVKRYAFRPGESRRAIRLHSGKPSFAQ